MTNRECETCQETIRAAIKQASCPNRVNCMGGKGKMEDVLVESWAKKFFVCREESRGCPNEVREGLGWLLEGKAARP